jgi:uncharacterized protein (DUF1810 family)
VSSDPFNLNRFIEAQAHDYEIALRELRAGSKTSHWIWYILPQIAGLGRSAMAERFAIRNIEEARAYLAHPVLGPRLRECANTLLSRHNRSAHEILGSPDDLKLRSSMTLFAAVAPNDVFDEVLEQFFRGERDPLTLRSIGASS